VSVSAVSASPSTVRLSVDTVRTLAMDAVQQANSGHPGTPMALAPLAYALYTRHLRHDPANPDWMDRDRFVLSVGHASMLLYASLHLAGYDVSLDDLKAFRQWGSNTAGHPEYGHTDGVETTTGPLGQGVANAVGFALAESHLAAAFNRDGVSVVDHYTYFIAGDGCLMEGISHEAASFAGHFKLGKLIGFFDDNSITIDGRTDLTCSDDAAARFASYGWQVLHLPDVNDQDAIDRVIAEAKADTERPTLIITKTVIGFGSPNRADTAKAHGEPLGAAEIVLTKDVYAWPSHEPFHVPAEAVAHWRDAVATRAETHDAWRARWDAYRAGHPDLAESLARRMQGELPSEWEAALPAFNAANGSMASRAASGAVLAALAPALPELLGGSADLTGSNLTQLKGGGIYSASNPGGRYVHYGIREHAMGAIMNGVALHGGCIPFGGTFLVFADYMRPAIRLAALMKQRVIYVFTHDSIGLGEDGPTHQPVEHLSSLRCIPGLTVLRPADAAEVVESWKVAINHRSGPVALVLSRQSLPWLELADRAQIGVSRGAYVLQQTDGGAPQVVLMSTGSEVGVALNAAALLEAQSVRVRVVSAPSLELFAAQDAEYRTSVLPAGVPRVAVEAAHSMSWHRWVGDTGAVVGIDTFGASAPAPVLFKEFGITAEHVAAAARGVLG
jgi:transketolase